MKKVWYHPIWSQTYLGFIVIILMYRPVLIIYFWSWGTKRPLENVNVNKYKVCCVVKALLGLLYCKISLCRESVSVTSVVELWGQGSNGSIFLLQNQKIGFFYLTFTDFQVSHQKVPKSKAISTHSKPRTMPRMTPRTTPCTVVIR